MDVGYPCAHFGLARPLYSRLRPDIRDRQTDVRRQTDARQKHHLMPLPIRGGGIITMIVLIFICIRQVAAAYENIVDNTILQYITSQFLDLVQSLTRYDKQQPKFCMVIKLAER